MIANNTGNYVKVYIVLTGIICPGGIDVDWVRPPVLSGLKTVGQRKFMDWRNPPVCRRKTCFFVEKVYRSLPVFWWICRLRREDKEGNTDLKSVEHGNVLLNPSRGN